MMQLMAREERVLVEGTPAVRGRMALPATVGMHWRLVGLLRNLTASLPRPPLFPTLSRLPVALRYNGFHPPREWRAAVRAPSGQSSGLTLATAETYNGLQHRLQAPWCSNASNFREW